jgi:outer membrane protein insertion porin family
VTSIKAINHRRRIGAALLVGTSVLCPISTAWAQAAQPAPALGTAPAAPPPAAPPPAAQPEAPAPAPPEAPRIIRSISVVGNQRVEPETVISYTNLRIGQTYTNEALDEALRQLIETELFTADTRIRDNQGNLTIEVRENPVINRIVLEGNKKIKDDKILPEIKLAPRQIFTRSKVRADVARIIELYRRQGRFAAEVEPKIVQLDQNRVDLVFEITEGAKSKVRQINILGNQKFSDGDLRGQMVTKQARWTRFFSSNDIYDPDRLAYDQQKLRQFYFTNGYMDFRVVSAVAELTPDKKDFIITYVVEEGERYKVGDVKVESEIRDFTPATIQKLVPLQKGQWYNAKTVEDTVTRINETAGTLGYAFADVRPQLSADKAARTMSVDFHVGQSPRVYIERIDINGNTHTRDKVIRREFRLAEGDPFNSVKVKRSKDRIQSLGYFQDKLEIEQQEGSAPDRVVLVTNLEEKSTGDLTVSAGFSSLERFLVNLSITERNFMGKGQTLEASINYSSYSKSALLGFTEPHIFDTDVGFGVQIYRQDYDSFRLSGGDRSTTYQETTTGGRLTLLAQLTEYMGLQLRYVLHDDKITLGSKYFSNGVCDPLKAGRYLCDALGKRMTSAIGYTLAYEDIDSRLHPTRGFSASWNQDFAGLLGDVKYLRNTVAATKYFRLGGNFVLSTSAQGGTIMGFNNAGPNIDKVRISDRFFLTEYPQQVRGFDIRGIGPRVIRTPLTFDANGVPTASTDKNSIQDDALGGRNFYLLRAEIEIPLSQAVREMGIRPSVFVDAGAVWGLKSPIVNDPGVPYAQSIFCIDTSSNITNATPNGSGGFTCASGSSLSGFREQFKGNSAKPRLSVGFGINWNSPFGPFRIDIAKALLKVPGDDTKLINFSVGTAF